MSVEKVFNRGECSKHIIFTEQLKNDKMVPRPLLYSKRKDATFCFPYTLLGSLSNTEIKPELEDTRREFNDWCHLSLLNMNTTFHGQHLMRGTILRNKRVKPQMTRTIDQETKYIC